MEKKSTQDASRHYTQINTLPSNNTRFVIEDSPAVIIVRAEEILLVVLVLLIWLAAIALFFNRWGKIRMLEPYQPKFQQQHRPSCPMGDAVITPQQRMSFSKFGANACDNLYANQPLISPYRRPRQNSVFVNSSIMNLRPPRRVKSAIDIQQMFADQNQDSFRSFNSLLPMPALNLGGDKKTYYALDKPPQNPKPKGSFLVDQRPLVMRHYHPSKNYLRRPSCFLDKPRIEKHHSHFMSLDQQFTNRDRRLSIATDRLSCNRRKPLINIEHSFEQPAVLVEPPPSTSSRPDSDNIIIPEGNVEESLTEPLVTNDKCPSIHVDIPLPNNNIQLRVDSFEVNDSEPESNVYNNNAIFLTDDISEETHIKLSALEYCKVSDV